MNITDENLMWAAIATALALWQLGTWLMQGG